MDLLKAKNRNPKFGIKIKNAIKNFMNKALKSNSVSFIGLTAIWTKFFLSFKWISTI
jgi:hypothetical protein